MDETCEKVFQSFLNQNEDNFLQFFEKHRQDTLLKRKYYIELEKEKEKILDEFPKVADYLENGRILDMTDDEKQAVLKVIDIDEEIKVKELKEAFKLGFKEAYIYFEDMNMLSI